MKKIVVLGTGGTIAGRRLSADAAYTAGQIPVQALFDDLPVRGGLALEFEQVAQIDSKDMSRSVWLALAQRCQHHLLRSDVDAVVVTHGTDTAEETAWFLSCVLGPSKPLVLTCAMRPADAADADGPKNLCDALDVASDARATGVLMVCAGWVHEARHVQKVHPTQLDAFSSGDAGPVGQVQNGGVTWMRSLETATAHAVSADVTLKRLASLTHWPRVEIVLSHALADGAHIEVLCDAQAHQRLGRQPVDGLVMAGTGNMTLHQSLLAALRSAQEAGVRVVLVSRCAQPVAGVVDPGGLDKLRRLAGLSAVKARVSLLLELSTAAVE